MEVSPVEALLTSIGSIFTQIITWVGNVASTIVSTPVLLIPVSFVLISFVVGIFFRLLKK